MAACLRCEKEVYFMKFTVTFCTFQGVKGYILKQWNDGICICSQFIPERHFTEFCTAAGIDESKIEFEK